MKIDEFKIYNGIALGLCIFTVVLFILWILGYIGNRGC